MFEETLRGAVSHVLAELGRRAGSGGVQGEITLLVTGAEKKVAILSAEELSAEIRRRRDEGASLKEVARKLADEHGLSRRDVYQLGLSLEKGS
jgi:16S rRNA C1402 (ribose-2'-O) methylase RsmI